MEDINFQRTEKKSEFTLKVAFSLPLPLSMLKLPIITPKSGVHLAGHSLE